jgi:hypothetical protein
MHAQKQKAVQYNYRHDFTLKTKEMHNKKENSHSLVKKK